MLSYLKSLKTFMNGPLVQTELATLRRHKADQHSLIRGFWRIFAVVAACIASIPLWIDMPDSPRSMLLFPLIMLAVYIVHLNVALKTLTLASHSVAREAVAENWDNLILTGVNARKIVLAKWLAVMWSVWRDYLWAASLKFGLAIGLAKYFDDIFIGSCYRHLAGGLCYTDRYSSGAYYASSLFSLTIFASLLGLFSFAEAGLLTALGLCFGSLNRRHRMVGMAGAAVVRGMLIVGALAIWLLLGVHSRALSEQLAYSGPGPNPALNRWNLALWERQSLLGSAQIALSPLADSGTVFVTDLLRPYMFLNHVVQRLLLAGISLSLIGILIWLTLRAAEMLAVWQHALRPEKRELRTAELAT